VWQHESDITMVRRAFLRMRWDVGYELVLRDRYLGVRGRERDVWTVGKIGQCNRGTVREERRTLSNGDRIERSALRDSARLCKIKVINSLQA
jgi:hypothetical protein